MAGSNCSALQASIHRSPASFTVGVLLGAMDALADVDRDLC